MKSFVVFCAIVVLAQAMSDEIMEEVKKQKQTCGEEVGMPADIMQRIMNKEHGIPNSPKMNEFSYCVVTKMGIVDDSGNVNKDKIMAAVDDDHKDVVEKTLDGCIADIGKVTKDNAYSYCECMHKNAEIKSF